MVQAADVRRGDDFSALGRLDFALNRRVVVERHVGAALMIIAEKFRQQPLEVRFVEYDHVCSFPKSRSRIALNCLE